MKRFHTILFILFVLGLAWSAYQPKEYFTWFLEAIPALAGIAVLTPVCLLPTNFVT